LTRKPCASASRIFCAAAKARSRSPAL
jgi:hypothetical protein